MLKRSIGRKINFPASKRKGFVYEEEGIKRKERISTFSCHCYHGSYYDAQPCTFAGILFFVFNGQKTARHRAVQGDGAVVEPESGV